ncbi:hypothetical protein BS17DRAFT_822996 [Gyrodon lividus]|nr:hypothetical protein BS17DRAFT_822996 [Gyrodon lividus]
MHPAFAVYGVACSRHPADACACLVRNFAVIRSGVARLPPRPSYPPGAVVVPSHGRTHRSHVAPSTGSSAMKSHSTCKIILFAALMVSTFLVTRQIHRYTRCHVLSHPWAYQAIYPTLSCFARRARLVTHRRHSCIHTNLIDIESIHTNAIFNKISDRPSSCLRCVLFALSVGDGRISVVFSARVRFSFRYSVFAHIYWCRTLLSTSLYRLATMAFRGSVVATFDLYLTRFVEPTSRLSTLPL